MSNSPSDHKPQETGINPAPGMPHGTVWWWSEENLPYSKAAFVLNHPAGAAAERNAALLASNLFFPRFIAVDYGPAREAASRWLSARGYSLLFDDTRHFVAARVQHLSGERWLPDTRNFTARSGRPGYEQVQKEAEHRLHEWLHRPAQAIERIVIVGGHLGFEVQ